MKLIPFFTTLLLFAYTQIHSQSPSFECGTDRTHQYLMQTDTAYRTGFNLYAEKLTSITQQQSASNTSRMVVTIPVVVHVIHTGGSNHYTILPDDTIRSAIDGVNYRFRNLNGSGTDMELQFCLASRDPNGYATNGIVRVDGSGIPNYVNGGVAVYPSNGNCSTAAANDLAIKNLSRWPTDQYYNIWIVNNICGGGGYAQLPNESTTTALNDGAVLPHYSFRYGLVDAAHELGHAFGLLHTFQGSISIICPPSGSNYGDLCDDTPPHRQDDCDPNMNPCTSIGIWHNSYYNYMSYCRDSWPNPIDYGRFTSDQKDRIQNTLILSPRSSLLSSPGCTQGACPPPSNDECMGNFAAVPLTFGNSCNPVTKSSCGATPSGFTDCSGVQAEDVFFSFVPSTSSATITIASSAWYDAAFQVLTGPCGTSMTQVGNSCINSTGAGGTETVTLTGLTTNTPYYIRVWHSGAFSTTADYSICVYGSTSSSCPTPGSTSQSSITQTSATLTWGNVSSAINYTVQYRVSGTSTWSTASVSNTSHPLSGLACNTTYEWQVRSNCSSGNSSYSAIKTFTTNSCGTPCTAPSNDNCSNNVPAITSNGACVNGTVACANGSYGANQCSGCTCTSPDDKDVYFQFIAEATSHTVTLSNYASNFDGVIELRSACSSGTAIGCYDPTGTPTTISNTWYNLTIGLTYYIRVFEYNYAGTPPSSPTFTVCVTHSGGSNTTCNTPAGLTTTNLTQNSATLNWATVPSATSYTLQVRQSGSSWSTFNTTSTSYSFTGFACNTTYEWVVSTNCSGGSSSFTTVQSFTTLGCGGGNTCSPPTGLAVSNISQNSASLSWNSVSSITYYIVRYRTGGASWSATNTTNTSFSLSGLSCNAVYEWQIEAVCANGSYATTGTSFTTSTCTNGCTNTNLERTVDAPTCSTGLLTIYTAQWQNEYNRINNVVGGTSYVSTFSLGGWITVRYGTYNGTLVAQGSSPFTWIANQGSGTYFIHYNTNSACGQATNPGTSTIETSDCSSACSAPIVVISNIEEHSAEATWNNIPSATNYTFEYTISGGSSWNSIGTIGTNTSIGGLTCGAQYDWRAQVICSDGSSSNWSTGSFTTDSCNGTGNCSNAIQWGQMSAPASCATSPASVSTYQGDYVALYNAVAGSTYVSDFTLPGYITIRSGTANGPVVAQGITPVTWTATSSGTYYIHHNPTGACEHVSIHGTATIALASCIPCSAPTGISFSGNQSVCFGSTTTISVSASNCGGSCIYNWSNNLGTGSSKILSAGTYIVTATNSCGSSTLSTITITVNPTPGQPDTINGSTAICSGYPQTYTIPAVPDAADYTWTYTGVGTISGNGTSISFIPPGSGTLGVIANNSCGNSIQRTLAIIVYQTPAVSISPSNANICSGGNGTQLNAISDAQNFAWSPVAGLNSTTTQSVIANPTNTTTYTVTVTNANCSATAASVVTVTNQLTASINPVNAVICGNSSLSLTATNGSAYNWSGPNGFIDSSQTVLIITAGNYTVTVTNPDGCSGSATASIAAIQNPSLIVDAGANQVIQSGDSVELGGTPTATGGTPPYTYSWDPTNNLSSSTVPNPYASPASNTTYNLTVTDANGCYVTDNVNVVSSIDCQTFLFDSLNISVPNYAATYILNLTTGPGCPWSVSEGCSWLSFNDTAGNGTSLLTFSLTENTLTTPRTCYVNIQGSILTITQGQAAPCTGPISDFTASPQAIFAGNSVAFTDISANNPSIWEWSFQGGSPSTSSAQNPQVTYMSGGLFGVTLKTTNNCGVNTVTKTNYINVIGTVGIEKNITENRISIYPNPNKGTFKIVAKVTTQNAIQIKVYSTIGQLVLEDKLHSTLNNIEHIISVPGISPGVYLLQVIVDNKPTYYKLVIE